jgi:hypothetical protein
LPALLEVVGEAPALADAVADRKVNRSLAPDELALVREANRLFANPDLSAALADQILSRWPDRESGGFPGDYVAEFDAFAASFAGDLRKLRGAGMDRLRGLLFDADAREPVQHAAPDPARRAELLEMLLGQVAGAVGELSREAALYRRLRGYSATLSPSDAFFDPIHYLLLHEDLVAALVDPWTHFLDYGRAEGRNTALVRKDLT